MDNIENIPLILHQIEGKFNALEIEKEKLTNPRFFDPLIVNNEIARLEDEILPMKMLLMSEKDIQRQKERCSVVFILWSKIMAPKQIINF